MKTPATDQGKSTLKPPESPNKKPSPEALAIAAKMLAARAQRKAEQERLRR